MKILRVTGDIYPEVMGGVGLHTYYMSKLQAKKHDVVVYTCGKDNYSKKKDNFKIVSFKPLIRIFGNPLVFNMAYGIYKNAKKFDIVHAHSHLFFTTNICAVLKKLCNFPLVITNHGLYSQTLPLLFQKIYMKTIGKFTLKSADKIICYTNIEKNELMNIGISKGKIKVIHNGINFNDFKKIETGKKETNILWVGRFVEGKGINYLKKILSNILKETEAKAIIVGDGQLKKEFISFMKKNKINNKIKYISNISNKEMPKIYNLSDILILTSINEGIPRTILEAMSSEVPVVSSNLPQLKKVIGNAGFLVNPKNTNLFVSKIKELINGKALRRKLGKRGRAIIKNKFSWEDTVNKTLEMYKNIIKNEK